MYFDLGFDQTGPYGLTVPEGSAAEQAAALLPDSAVVTAFHHVAAATLLDPADHDEHEDVLVCGDNAEAKETVAKLASTVAGRPGVDGGPLRMARYLEPLTAVLIAINKRYQTRCGIAVTGLREHGRLSAAVALTDRSAC